jgi:hypothetical protein
MRKLSLCITGVVVLAAVNTAGAESEGAPPSFETALADAKGVGKPLIIEFSAVW